mmetsp:Transcript_34843/g.56394  ORF Transcript_34843/g.56394 Transcript_34843/m.56394 type:complete len:100 (-) Transcript_34843:45-344(-)
MALLHPDLDQWMVRVGYGMILSRPGPTPRERELCAVAALAGLSVSPQLISHIRGALRVGATREECRAVLDHTEAIFGAAAQEEVDAVWMTIDSSRAASL